MNQPVVGRYQFSLKAMLILTVIAAMGFGSLARFGALGLIVFVTGVLVAEVFWEKRSAKDSLMRVIAVLLSGALLVALALPAMQSAHGSGNSRQQCANQLKIIILATHNYESVYGSLPPAFVADSQGRPMHSWRVLLLPFLGQQALYDRYDFSEPWDGPHNRRLHAEIVSEYSCRSDLLNGQWQPTKTSYVAIVGPGTVWPDGKATALRDVSHPDRTLLIVEAANSGIHWMEPRDFRIDQVIPTINSPLGQSISSRHQRMKDRIGFAHAGFADGSIQPLPATLSVDEIRAMLSTNDSESSPK